jgi:hypothetical protein
MKIVLLNHHEAIVIDDGSEVVTIDPEVSGTLVINGVKTKLSPGDRTPTFDDRNNASAAFVTDAGITFKILSPRIYKGVLTTRLDPYAVVLEYRLLIDGLEKELEEAREDISKLRGSIKYDSLGFIEI